MASCPVCSESFTPDNARAHLVAFHAGSEEEWSCGVCAVRGSFDAVAAHCFLRRHDSGAMLRSRNDDLPSLLRDIQAKLGLLKESEAGQAWIKAEPQEDAEFTDYFARPSVAWEVTQDQEADWDAVFDEKAEYNVTEAEHEMSQADLFRSQVDFVAQEERTSLAIERSRTRLAVKQKRESGLVPRPNEQSTTACPDCHLDCSTAAHLARHRKRCPAAERPWSCTHCPARFTLERNRNTHQTYAHGVKRHACDSCSGVFGVKSALAQHALLHSGERPFACTQCPAAFRQKHALTEHHRRRHTKERPFKCSRCSYSASVRYDLKSHEANRHANEI